MTASAKPTARQFQGIGLETTPGTAVSATAFLPHTKFDPMDNQQWLDDLGARGSMAQEYDEVAGVVASQIQCGGDVYADGFGWYIAGLMGDVAVSGAGAPFTHVMGLLNSGDGQPPSYTLWDYYGRTDSNPARKYAGCKVGEVHLAASAEGLLQWTAVLNGFASAVGALPSQSFSSVTAEPTWEGTVTLGGSSTAILEQCSIDLVRAGAGPIFNIDGDANPYEIFSGKLGVSGAMTVIMETDAELNRYVGSSKGTTGLTLDWTHGTSSALVEVKAQMTKIQYTSPTKIERGKEYIEVSTTFKAIANSTDVGASAGLGPILWTLKNANASGTYK